MKEIKHESAAERSEELAQGKRKMKDTEKQIRSGYRRNRILLGLSILIFLLIYVLIYKVQNSVWRSGNLNGPYAVEYVKDGDTIVCNIDGESVTVRFIGVDTPESVHSDQSKNCEEGKEASEYTGNLLENKEVYLEYDASVYDRYGRVLAYVYLDDVMVNSLLLEKGYARTMVVEPNTKYAEEFGRIEETAKKKKEGFWDGYFD